MPLLAITGGTGFVGGKVIRHALDTGYKVRALIRNPAKKPDIIHENLSWHKGALGDDDAAFTKNADTVIHIAGLIKAKTRAEFDAVNVHAAGEMAKSAKDNGVKRFILLSSMAAREPHLSGYAGSKHDGENAVRDVYPNAAIIRAPAVFGPGDKATEPFFDALKSGLQPVPGGSKWKERRLSMVYVEDLARDIISSGVVGDYDGRTVSPATMPNMTWPDFAKMCEQAFERKIKILPLPRPVLYSVGGVTSFTLRFFGIGHLTLEKLGEFLHPDWSSEELIQSATPPKDALRITMRAYEPT